MALPQNALFLISFGEYTFNTISNSHKLPQLNSFIAVSNKISRKGGKPNARVKGVNLMRGFEGNGWKASTCIKFLNAFCRPNQLIESSFTCR